MTDYIPWLPNTDVNRFLIDSVFHNNIEGVSVALDNGANINNNDSHPLRAASINGNLEMVKYLISKGANKRIADAAHDAELHCNYDVADYLYDICNRIRDNGI